MLISGLRGSAWVSVLKDALVILTIAFLAIYLPLKLFGSLRRACSSASAPSAPSG